MQVSLDGSPAVGGIKEALMFPGCANFQPVQYIQGLAEAFKKAGGRIYEDTRVLSTDKTYVRARLPHDVVHHEANSRACGCVNTNFGHKRDMAEACLPGLPSKNWGHNLQLYTWTWSTWQPESSAHMSWTPEG